MCAWQGRDAGQICYASRIRPKYCCFVMPCRRGCGLPRRFAPRNDMQKLVRCQRLQERPARANPQPVTYLPEVLLIVLCYCGDADCHTSSPQSPPCPAPAKGQSRATLPCVSFPHKACRFAGPRGYAGRRPAEERNDVEIRVSAEKGKNKAAVSQGRQPPCSLFFFIARQLV